MITAALSGAPGDVLLLRDLTMTAQTATAEAATMLGWAPGKPLLALVLPAANPTVATNKTAAFLTSAPGLAYTTPEWARGQVLLDLGLMCTTRTSAPMQTYKIPSSAPAPDLSALDLKYTTRHQAPSQPRTIGS